MSYFNVLTPSPSSNEDSPHSFYNETSPGCFQRVDNDPLLYILPMQSEDAPFLEVIEQPVDRFRFRYKSEMTGTHGSLCGQTSDKSRKSTYPTIKLHNYTGKAVLRCSIYQQGTTADNKPHAHRLVMKVGKGECDDPHDVNVNVECQHTHIFNNMGIIHTAKKNLEKELIRKKTQLKEEEIARMEGIHRKLNLKEDVQIKGLAAEDSKSINLNVVCLRFDAFAINKDKILRPICPPVFSQSINNLKSALTGELKIVRMDHCKSPAKGNQEIFLLVERVAKKNIKVRFFEVDDDNSVIWEDYGKFSDLDVHHQYAIVFKTPAYKNTNIVRQVKVFIELERPSDNSKSEPREFFYVPSTNQPGVKRARNCFSSDEISISSNELPTSVTNLNIENLPLFENVDNMEFTSDDLELAKNNINSAEFYKLFKNFGLEYQSVTTDSNSPIMTKKKICNNGNNQNSEFLEAKKVVEGLRDFIKSKPDSIIIVEKLNRYFSTENKTNPLHLLLKANENSLVMMVLKMFFVYKLNALFNIKNDDGQGLLHIAVMQKNEEILTNLHICQPNVNIEDNDQNTPLHLAVLHSASPGIFEKLLSCKNIKPNSTNAEGYTALDLAIEGGNFIALKLLCRRCDVNHKHNKSGYTPLRLAIEKENVEFVAYLLQISDIDPLAPDFKQVTPLQAGVKKDNPELKSLIQDFMKKHNYPDIEIKSEVDDEELIEELIDIKPENISPDDLRGMYESITNFTSACLDEVSNILDESGNWNYLAELLDLEHLLRTDNIGDVKSPAKMLLRNAVETNGANVYDIRNFLEDLDEIEAVQIIDEMVKNQFV